MFDPRSLFAFLILVLLIAAVAALVFVVISLLFNTSAVKARALKKQAKEDYHQARGTAHRQLLEAAHTRLQKDIARCNQQIKQAEQEKRRLVRLRSQKIDEKLVRYLVENRLQEIRGIGETTQRQIATRIFHGKLSDLRRAHLIQGVGEQKQWNINQWISKYEAKLPKMHQQDFPGKQAVVNEFQTAVKKQEKIVEDKTIEVQQLSTHSKPIKGELDWLRPVSAKDFIQAYTKQLGDSEVVDRYLCGVFPEWDSMPDWFKNVVTDESS
jgi:hypothetical protein